MNYISRLLFSLYILLTLSAFTVILPLDKSMSSFMSQFSLAESGENWYALKVFHNKVSAIEARLDALGDCECYVPQKEVVTVASDGRKLVHMQPAIAGLLFLKVAGCRIKQIREIINGHAMFYPSADGSAAVISEREMLMFRLVTSAQANGLEYLSDSVADYSVGQRVRVLQGPFRGAEGFIRRIRGNRRLVVSISGICAVATSYIPASFLERLP